MFRAFRHVDRSKRAERLIARARHKQLDLARAGRVVQSAHYARRVTRLRRSIGEAVA